VIFFSTYSRVMGSTPENFSDFYDLAWVSEPRVLWVFHWCPNLGGMTGDLRFSKVCPKC
jgi:hypothetical protein